MKYRYRTFTIESTPDEIDQAVEANFAAWQGQGWEYVSGPVVERYVGMGPGDSPSTDYTFLLRAPIERRSAYAEEGDAEAVPDEPFDYNST